MAGLGRAERRAISLDAHTQPAADLAIARMGIRVYVGIRRGGRCRISLEEARQLAGSLLEISDPDYQEAN